MKKICKWLDKNQISGMQIRNDGNIYPCTVRWISLFDEDKRSDYNTIPLEYIQERRRQFLEEINEGKYPECQTCNLLCDADDETADIGPLKHLVYHPHTLCNLDCRYCFYTDEERRLPISEGCKDLFETIKHFYEIGLIDKENFGLDLGGGEPLLLKNIDKTLDFINERYENAHFNLLSNSALVEKVNEMIDILKKGYTNIKKILITSIDCGTQETYKYIRKKDLYYEVANNLYNYAKNGVFDVIILKYILLDDKINSGDDDIWGFLELCKLISETQSKDFHISLDVDWLKRKEGDRAIPDHLLKVAGKMYYLINEIMHVHFLFISDYLSENTKEGLAAINKIKEYSKEYKYSEKSYKEIYLINNLRKTIIEEIKLEMPSKVNFLQNLFSVKNEADRKIIRILGFKIKLKGRK